tara:strand:+ start:111 stop:404 length:294 start_codon:yes stop_codon:yes gene_type:complete
MNLIDGPFYDNMFRNVLNESSNDLILVLRLLEIKKGDIIGEFEWNDRCENFLDNLKKKYNDDGKCYSGIYPIASKNLQLEYDATHCIIRSFLDDQFV